MSKEKEIKFKNEFSGIPSFYCNFGAMKQVFVYFKIRV
jgi:hypothetical protein